MPLSLSMDSTPRAIRETITNQSIFNPEFLRKRASWIRDELDPVVARHGPQALDFDSLLELDELVRRLLTSEISLEDIRYTRIYLAIRIVASRATRWPSQMINRCDELLEKWDDTYGEATMGGLHIVLYEPGGRLHGVARPEDTSDDKLLVQWLKTPGVKLNPARARRTGDLGFVPGDWWINPILAFRDGIIDSGDTKGGTVCDADGVYALLLTDNVEVEGSSFDRFTYRPDPDDKGKFKLMSGTEESKRPIRVLRSHAVRSFWAPRAGVRYDGLYKVTGWRMLPSRRLGNAVLEIMFQRLPCSIEISKILSRPLAEEEDDYKEYKRIRRECRAVQTTMQATQGTVARRTR